MLVDLERCGLSDRTGVDSSDMPVGEECRRRWSGFVNHLIVKHPNTSGMKRTSSDLEPCNGIYLHRLFHDTEFNPFELLCTAPDSCFLLLSAIKRAPI